LWAHAPTAEEVVRGAGRRRAPAAACGVFEVGLLNKLNPV
jgi:hypothetical protein